MDELQVLTYGTVRDYCESCDKYPELSHLQGDLKDLQRPSAFKKLTDLCSPGDSLLEIGAGSPHVAAALAKLGYRMTIVDPYDGSAGGPSDYEFIRTQFPELRVVRAAFNGSVAELGSARFRCIYSISVLEHLQRDALTGVFEGIRQFLEPPGYSVHIVDHVLAGATAEFHLGQLQTVIQLQSRLSGEPESAGNERLGTLLLQAAQDVDTYFLSAEGHNLWRGQTPYSQFPFRRVMSVETVARYAA